LLQSKQLVKASPPRKEVVHRPISLSQTELSETFAVVHRDAYHKVYSVDSNATLLSAIGACNYLNDLAYRTENEKYVLHAQTAQIAIHAYISYNPAMCMSVFDTLVPLHDKLTKEVFFPKLAVKFFQGNLIQIQPTLGNSEWVLVSYAIVLASIGQFDQSMIYEKRALQLASKHPEIAASVYACLYFIKHYRGEELR
jgi:hypothetical protein